MYMQHQIVLCDAANGYQIVLCDVANGDFCACVQTNRSHPTSQFQSSSYIYWDLLIPVAWCK